MSLRYKTSCTSCTHANAFPRTIQTFLKYEHPLLNHCCRKRKSFLSMAILTFFGTSDMDISMITRIKSKTCSKNTNISIQSLLDHSGAKAWTSLSSDNNVKLVITDITLVTLKAMLQAPISRTPLGVGFLINLHSFQASIFNDSKQFTRAKKEARG